MHACACERESTVILAKCKMRFRCRDAGRVCAASTLTVYLAFLCLCAVSSAEIHLRYEPADDSNAFFISEIFDKYGNNNSITFEGFEHLLENLGLGKLKFETHHDVSIHKVNGTFMEIHDELSLHRHNHSFPQKERERRNVAEDETQMRYDVVKHIKRRCLTPQDILITYGLQPYHDAVISPAKYLQICPAIIYELDQKLCQGKDQEPKPSDHPHEYRMVWIYASITIFIMSVSGIVCVLIVPVVKKASYSSVVQFLISLAVGTLCGDAIIHLLPQVYSSHHESSGSHLTPALKGVCTLFAIFLFFVIENILKEIKYQKGNKAKVAKESGRMLPSGEVESSHCGPGHHTHEVKTLAWMAVIGDILHNVTDGLSIGAAFSSSLSSGFASSIAIFCHELPHELGDYVILLESGMSVRKSLFYNFLSSVFSFFGMVAGILLGEIHDASLWINAFTAGSFLYIALSDLVPEMKLTSSFQDFLVQLFGVACGGILMLAIAVYEDKIEDILC